MGSATSYMRGTPGPSGFGSTSTAEDVTDNMDLSSKTVIVTGTTSGIGKETTRVLAKRGAHVIVGVRNVKSGEIVKAEILEETPAARLTVLHLDLSSLTSVREFVSAFKSRNLPLNILINNAGLVWTKFELTEDGVEKVFGVNHLGAESIKCWWQPAFVKHAEGDGPFLLTNLLLDTLKATANKTGVEGRIVNVSSDAHRFSYRCGLLLDKTNDPKRFYAFQAYGQSKLANILHAKELARHLKEEGANVTANALHPGSIATGLGSQILLKNVGCAIINTLLKTIPMGAATSCYVATSPDLKGVTGKYFQDCNELTSVSPAAKDMQMAAALWKYSEELVSGKQ